MYYINNKKKLRFGFGAEPLFNISTFLWASELQNLIFKILMTVYWGSGWGRGRWRCQDGRDVENVSSTSLIWVFSVVYD